MAGLRRSKRLESCNQPGQDKVTKIARTSKDQEQMVPGKNEKTGRSLMEGPSDPGIGRASLDNPSPNASEQQLGKEEAVWKEAQQKEGQASAKLARGQFKNLDDGLEDFRRLVQSHVGLGYQQGFLFKMWDKLHSHIMKISEVAGFKDLPWDSLDEAAQQKFIGYSPHAQQLFETPLIRQFMFARWIWEIIDENFFSRKSQDIEWTSPYWEAQATMERILRERNFCHDEERRSVQYPNWRYTAIDFYYSLEEVGQFEKRIEPGCVVKIVEKAVGQYFPENPGPFFTKMLSLLAETVVSFELKFDCGRQTLRNVFHDPKTKEAYGFPFSATVEGFHAGNVMQLVCGDDDATYDGRPVDLVVSPMLVFYGDLYGYDYHVATVAFPMRVCVGYRDGFDQDEVTETEGDGEEEVKIIKDKEGGNEDEDETKIEDEECNSSLDLQPGSSQFITMALQPCRSGLWRSRHAARTLMPCVRTYATDSTPESFRTKTPSSSGVVPRWSQTPAAMKAPLQLDWAKNPQNKVWTVNNDPKKLDEVYERLLGPGGSKLLPEELKWLAVTHKSFDQGRRGFNDRLALLGRMTLVMETTKTIVAQSPMGTPNFDDGFDRQPFVHPNLQSVDNLSIKGPKDVVGKERLSGLAAEVGLIDVVRWKPKQVQKLRASGADVVLNGAIMAIIGAITLQHGAVVASQVIRERILSRLQD
ncbi:hypothetical protein ACJA88_005947 [Fusarium oxysporum]